MPRHALVACLLLVSAPTWAAASDPTRVQYNRDVRPILSDKCFRCHGPDAAQRQAHLRLDRREDAVLDQRGCRPIAPGKPAESEVYRRITAEDVDERMPPHDSSSTLSPREIDTLRRWIEQGAEYQPHWAFIAPKQAPLPEASRSDWCRDPIDRFVLAELMEQKLAPMAETDRRTLARRASLDLTGLPPTPEEVDRFVADSSSDAYERFVDRLLASPRFGERLALDWLDGARYADTNGYYSDLERHSWRWRDWVIAAFNRNQPFDRFTVEQLAGDLLPGATDEQRVATGFNRNHMVTNESGVIDEEARVGYVVDRIDTTTTVWLGLTAGCARCHDHKYDPISQREYYELFAYFNNVPEQGLVKDLVNPAPVIALPTAEQQRRLTELAAERKALDERLRGLEPELKQALAAWEPTAIDEVASLPEAGLAAHFPLDGAANDRGPRKLAGSAIGQLVFAPGAAGQAAEFDATQYVEVDDGMPLERDKPFSLAVWIRPEGTPTGCVVSKMASTADARGFEIIWYKARPRINLVHQLGRNTIEVASTQSFGAKQWRHLTVTYDGSSRADGIKLYVDGQLAPTVAYRDRLSGSIDTPEPWRIAWKGMGVGFEGGLDELRLYDRPLAAAEVDALYWRELLAGAISTPAEERSKQQRDQLRNRYIAQHGSAELRRLSDESTKLRDTETAVRSEIVSTPIMAELEKPRATHVLVRGQYDQPSGEVHAGIPAALGKLPKDTPTNRLGLARWIVDPANPLTARVIVNHYWQLIFGEGLVRTANDFGLQGELPTHPELLDWLAVDFVRSGWDVKRLLKQMVTSATYRQSSQLTSMLIERDPENRLLARGPRYRLAPELLRDQALAIGGLLVERLGGRSVKPYQPPGLWEAVSYNGEQTYVPDQGDGLHRRSLYTYWKRQAPPPAMLAFDAPTRETCVVRRARTNTPLQALVLLNDVTYVEAARGLATQTITTGGSDPESRLRFAFRRTLGREPKPAELAALSKHIERQLAEYRAHPDRAQALLATAEAKDYEKLDRVELAAWTMTAGVLLNLDETITQH